MSFGHDFNPFVPPFTAKREIRVRETELIHTLIPDESVEKVQRTLDIFGESY
jgi:hypothetical protein